MRFTDKAFRRISTDDVERAIAEKARPREDRITVKRKGRAMTRPMRLGGRIAANRLLADLRALWRWAIVKDYDDRTPFAKSGIATVRATHEEPRTRRLEGDEEARLLAAAVHDRYAKLMDDGLASASLRLRFPLLRDLITAALETGCRSGELLSLQWSEVNWAREEIRLLPEKTKTARGRTLKMTAALKAILRRRMLDAAGDPMAGDRYVFGNEVGERVGSIKKAWGTACRRAGIEGLHFHDLRREAASRKLELDEPWGIHEISIWLGHANVMTTVRYLGVSERSVHRLVERDDARAVAASA